MVRTHPKERRGRTLDIVAIKVSLTPALMLAVSLAARRWGSMVGGLLAGLPLTSGPISIYLALEQGQVFAAHAAAGALSGTGATLIAYVAYLVLGRRWALVPTCVGTIGMLLVSAAILMAAESPASSIGIGILAIGAMIHLTQHASATRTELPLPAWDLPARLAASTAMVLAITISAAQLGPALSGILSPIPVIAWPLIVFAHAQGGRADAVAAVRGTAAGAVGILVFYLIVWLYLGDHGLVAVYGSALAGSVVVAALAGMALRWHADAGRDAL